MEANTILLDALTCLDFGNTRGYVMQLGKPAIVGVTNTELPADPFDTSSKMGDNWDSSKSPQGSGRVRESHAYCSAENFVDSGHSK
jgi:hypothetical protein